MKNMTVKKPNCQKFLSKLKKYSNSNKFHQLQPEYEKYVSIKNL